MIDEHIAVVFGELRRIGIDPDAIGARPIATGFTRRSLRDWLRQIPTGAGEAELEQRLDAHARETLATAERAGADAEHEEDRADRAPNPDPVRWWPTTLMLDAGTELLAEEWDPVGVRLGTVPAEDLGEYAFQLFQPLLARSRGSRALDRVSEMIGTIEEGELGLRRSPLVHRRYLAARLREIVARYPLTAEERRLSASRTAVMTPEDVAYDGPPALDPEGICSRCTRFGTVARVTTHTDPPRTVRYCGSCWREVRATYMSTAQGPPSETAHERIQRLDTEHGPPTSAESRSWDDAVEFLRLVLTARDDPDRGREITTALLSELAAEISADADKMDGPMPEEVERFLREYAPAS